MQDEKRWGGAARSDLDIEARMRTSHDSDPPPEWAGLLDADQWRRARTALGDQHLEELRTLLANVSEQFRQVFVDELDQVDDACPPHVAVVIAMARAANRAAEQACGVNDPASRTRGVRA